MGDRPEDQGGWKRLPKPGGWKSLAQVRVACDSLNQRVFYGSRDPFGSAIINESSPGVFQFGPLPAPSLISVFVYCTDNPAGGQRSGKNVPAREVRYGKIPIGKLLGYRGHWIYGEWISSSFCLLDKSPLQGYFERLPICCIRLEIFA